MKPRLRPTTTTVINRRELPVIERNPRERRPLLLIFILLGFLALGWFGKGVDGSHLSVSQISSLKIDGVSMNPVGSKSGIVWQVSGKLVNESKQSAIAPDLSVRLLRADGSEAVRSDIDMREQIIPGYSAIAFRSALQTGAKETSLTAAVTMKNGGGQ